MSETKITPFKISDSTRRMLVQLARGGTMADGLRYAVKIAAAVMEAAQETPRRTVAVVLREVGSSSNDTAT